MNKGQLPLLGTMMLFAIMVMRMSEAGVDGLVLGLVDGLRTGQLVGYVLAAIFALGWFGHAKWQRRQIDAEMRRLAEERNELQQERVNRSLESSNRR